MSEPSRDDIADTLSAAYRTMREQRDGINELRDALDFYSGSIIFLANLLVACIAFTVTFYLTVRILQK